jgi:hypothetical protein
MDITAQKESSSGYFAGSEAQTLPPYHNYGVCRQDYNCAHDKATMAAARRAQLLTDRADFASCLDDIIGLNPPTRDFVIDQGCSTMKGLMSMAPSEVDALITHAGRWRPQAARNPPDDPAAATAAAATGVAAGTRGAAAATGTVSAPIVSFTFVAVRRIKALHAWGEYRKARGEELDVNEFDEEELVRWLERLREMAAIKIEQKDDRPDTPAPLKNLSSFRVFEENLINALGKMRNAYTGVPLSYVLRANAVPTAEELAEVYTSIDDELHATSRLDTATFRSDNKRVGQYLKPLLNGTPAWPFVQTAAKKEDGRAMFLALKTQTEGSSAIATRKAKAYQMISSARYNGRGRNQTFDSYVARHQTAHNELQDLGEEVSETRKVRDFLEGITDNSLAGVKTIILGDTLKMSDFQECQQYLKTVVENLKTQGSDDRRAASMSTDHKGKPKGSRSPNLHTGTYSQKDYAMLTKEDRETIKQMRREERRNKGREKKRKAEVIESKEESEAKSEEEADEETDDDGNDNGEFRGVGRVISAVRSMQTKPPALKRRPNKSSPSTAANSKASDDDEEFEMVMAPQRPLPHCLVNRPIQKFDPSIDPSLDEYDHAVASLKYSKDLMKLPTFQRSVFKYIEIRQRDADLVERYQQAIRYRCRFLYDKVMRDKEACKRTITPVPDDFIWDNYAYPRAKASINEANKKWKQKWDDEATVAGYIPKPALTKEERMVDRYKKVPIPDVVSVNADQQSSTISVCSHPDAHIPRKPTPTPKWGGNAWRPSQEPSAPAVSGHTQPSPPGWGGRYGSNRPGWAGRK